MTKAEAGIGRRTGLMLLGATALAACAPRQSADIAPIDLFAAASLREVSDAAVAAYQSRSGRIVRTTYAGSAQLARQIAQGAPADLFIAADAVWMDWLEQRSLIKASARRSLASNRLVLIAPVSASGAGVDLASPSALTARLGDGRLAMAETAVPAGRYGREALTQMNLLPSVGDRLAPGDDVRAALALVARGEVPLGLVYATDALIEPRVRVVATFPTTSHTPIVYPAAPVRRRDDAGDPEGAQALLSFLAGGEGQALFQRFGFATVPV